MIGKTISHYKILEKLGEGGMGVVYKAEDITLGRTVALKFLPPELTHDTAARERFIHEARAASALDHPNICIIHEVAQTEDGQTFIAMAYCEGENLKSKIERGPLKLDEALEIAAQIAQGLAKAHGQGIVHRDIKPANILITSDGLVKIVDFGLAKLVGTKVTKTGTTLGTAQYMSPEQARGEAVDARSDIFSLGAVLYEMLTGKHAFPGEYEQSTLYAIMNEEPEPVTALRSGIPMELERIVVKALAKKPGERYQHADDLIVDLKNIAKQSVSAMARGAIRSPDRAARRKVKLWIPVTFLIIAAVAMSAYFILLSRSRTKKPAVTAVAPATTPQFAAQVWRDSIAVLPFKDFSPQKDQEYFCDGMMEDIITKLSSIRDLKVISRTSAMQYTKTDKSIGEIGRELGVGAVLEGSVQKEKDRIRVTAQLIRTADDAHLWAEKYDRGLASVFEVQDEISMAIVEALKLKLTSQEKLGMSKLPIDNVAAYECYLRATHEIRRFDEASLDRAHQDIQNGIAIIGDNALLYSGLAYAYYQYVNIGVKQEEYIEKAEAYAKKALALDADCPEAYVVLGKIYSAFRGNQQEAVRQFKKALSMNPNEQSALSSLAGSYVDAGKIAAALAVLEKCRQVDPLNVQNYNFQFDLYMMDGKYELALEWSRRRYEEDPENPLVQGIYAVALAYNNKAEEAISVVDKAVAATPNNVVTKIGLLLKYGLLKERDKAFHVMTPEFQETCKRDYAWSYMVGSSLSLLGAKSEALDWLENSVNRGFINYPFFERDPFLDNIRGEERFKKLMERVKYEWEHFEL